MYTELQATCMLSCQPLLIHFYLKNTLVTHCKRFSCNRNFGSLRVRFQWRMPLLFYLFLILNYLLLLIKDDIYKPFKSGLCNNMTTGK
jgi:hypothetical protein